MYNRYIINILVKLTSSVAIIILFSNIIFSQEPSQPSDFKLKTIVIDAGHGGKDPGACSKLGTEKALVLDIALKIGKILNNNFPEINVIYTRKTDVFVELKKRAEIANKAKANLFISIHANSNKSSSPYGTETYVLGLHRSKENFDLAMRENAVILEEDNYKEQYEGFDPNSPESYIIFSLLQNVNFDQSSILATKIQEQYKNNAKRKDRSVKQLGLLVLARSSMPSVLTEVGFISNTEESKYLFSEKGKTKIAESIYKAIKDYKNMYEGNTTENSNKEIKEIKEKPKVKKTKPLIKSTNDSIYLKVQIAISKEKIKNIEEEFKGLKNIEEILINNIYKYYVGNTTNIEKAKKIQTETRKIIPDAFIVAFKNNKKMNINEALKEIKH